MPKLLNMTHFGNTILREEAKRLSPQEIRSNKIQQLIEDMHFTLHERKYGIGLAAPQVGTPLAISVIGIKPTPTRPDLVPFSAVLINPVIVETFGEKEEMWEGCVSSGEGDNTLYAKVPRYKRIRLHWFDESAKEHDEILEGFVSHVAQHETDHLNGILFVDRVENTRTYMLADEYMKLTAAQKASS